jgi:hypothetical protein
MTTQGIKLMTEAEAKEDETRASVAGLELAVEELRAQGWTKDDFARALRDMLEG